MEVLNGGGGEKSRGRVRGRGRKIWRECVNDDMEELGLHLNGQCSGICGEASYRDKRLILAERG